MPPDAPLFQIFAFLFGAIVGSFLNVVIYRLPLGLGVNEPKRSFCPHCKALIPWHQNLPLLSWLLLRGKCARCGERIPFRYFAVELLTAALFLLIWRHGASAEAGGAALFIGPVADAARAALPLWVFAALLVAATWIDLDHMIIPDELTLGGAAAGLVFSLIAPGLMGESSRWMALLWSAIGAASGYLLVWGVVEAGKLAFGRKKETFEPPVRFRWQPPKNAEAPDEAALILGNESDAETVPWGEIFSRESDQLLLETEALEVNGEPLAKPASGSPAATLRFFHNRLLFQNHPVGSGESSPLLKDGETPLAAIPPLSGTLRGIVIPREAMGFGDVKFMACIGAFLGWKGALFSLGAGSAIGAVVGLALMITGRQSQSGRLPFGPYLALGALLWLFAGPELVGWYLGLVAAP